MSGINPRVASEWLAARAVVAAFLRELAPGQAEPWYEANAEALLARLAANDPPILLGSFRPGVGLPTPSEMGAKGGRARAASLSPLRRKEIARQAALARWARRKETRP